MPKASASAMPQSIAPSSATALRAPLEERLQLRVQLEAGGRLRDALGDLREPLDRDARSRAAPSARVRAKPVQGPRGS